MDVDSGTCPRSIRESIDCHRRRGVARSDSTFICQKVSRFWCRRSRYARRSVVQAVAAAAASATLAETGSAVAARLAPDWMHAPVGEHVVWHLDIPGQTTDLTDDDGEEPVGQAQRQPSNFQLLPLQRCMPLLLYTGNHLNRCSFVIAKIAKKNIRTGQLVPVVLSCL